MGNLEMRNMQDHYPHREDQVEAWIKDRRDQFKEGSPGYSDILFQALDNLLDEYRLAADTGQSLNEVVNGEEERPPPTARKKKKKGKAYDSLVDDPEGASWSLFYNPEEI